MQVALLYSQTLLLVVIPGILVFHYAWHSHHSCGLYVLTYFPESLLLKHSPCTHAWLVRVESSGEWYLNAKKIEPDRLPEALKTQMGARVGCLVFFEAESDVPYAEAIRAIDLIAQWPSRVVLLRSRAKPVHIP